MFITFTFLEAVIISPLIILWPSYTYLAPFICPMSFLPAVLAPLSIPSNLPTSFWNWCTPSLKEHLRPSLFPKSSQKTPVIKRILAQEAEVVVLVLALLQASAAPSIKWQWHLFWFDQENITHNSADYKVLCMKTMCIYHSYHFKNIKKEK